MYIVLDTYLFIIKMILTLYHLLTFSYWNVALFKVLKFLHQKFVFIRHNATVVHGQIYFTANACILKVIDIDSDSDLPCVSIDRVYRLCIGVIIDFIIVKLNIHTKLIVSLFFWDCREIKQIYSFVILLLLEFFLPFWSR